MTRILRSITTTTALAATLVLTSCGNTGGHDVSGMSGMTSSTSSAKGTPATGAKNTADVTFATMMIPHHAQAVVMADLALKRATDAKVKALAPKIKAAQGPEIARMSGWLSGWGEPLPDAAGGHDMSGSGGPTDGMMSTPEMTDLGAATGSGFDRMWLQMMVRHHEGAVAMARTQLDQGTNIESRELAGSIIDSQSTEIAEMKAILTGVPG